MTNNIILYRANQHVPSAHFTEFVSNALDKELQVDVTFFHYISFYVPCHSSRNILNFYNEFALTIQLCNSPFLHL